MSKPDNRARDAEAAKGSSAGSGTAGSSPLSTEASSTSLTADFPCSAHSAADARHLVTQACDRWQRSGLCDTAEIVASELVANALRHARSGVRLCLHATCTGMLIEVSDDSPRVPQRRDPGLYDESGRGLWLVEALARRWGVVRETPGKRVWAEVALTASTAC